MRAPARDAGPNAHAVAVDQETGRVVVPLATLRRQPVLRELSVEPTAATAGDD